MLHPPFTPTGGFSSLSLLRLLKGSLTPSLLVSYTRKPENATYSSDPPTWPHSHPNASSLNRKSYSARSRNQTLGTVGRLMFSGTSVKTRKTPLPPHTRWHRPCPLEILKPLRPSPSYTTTSKLHTRGCGNESTSFRTPWNLASPRQYCSRRTFANRITLTSLNSTETPSKSLPNSVRKPRQRNSTSWLPATQALRQPVVLPRDSQERPRSATRYAPSIQVAQALPGLAPSNSPHTGPICAMAEPTPPSTFLGPRAQGFGLRSPSHKVRGIRKTSQRSEIDHPFRTLQNPGGTSRFGMATKRALRRHTSTNLRGNLCHRGLPPQQARIPNLQRLHRGHGKATIGSQPQTKIKPIPFCTRHKWKHRNPSP